MPPIFNSPKSTRRARFGNTTAFGINDAGQIVGAFGNSPGTHGFLDTGGSFTQIDVPGAGLRRLPASTMRADRRSIFRQYRFPRLLDIGGSFTQIDVPGASLRWLPASMTRGRSSVHLRYYGSTHGFLDIGGSFTQIDVPGGIRWYRGFRHQRRGADRRGIWYPNNGWPWLPSYTHSRACPRAISLTLLGGGIGLTVLCVMRRRMVLSTPL